MSHPPVAHHRAHTRWILMGSVLAIAAIGFGAWWLEAVHPQLDTATAAVQGVPPLAMSDERSCRRLVEEAAVEEIQAGFPAGGRVSSTQIHLCPLAFDGVEVAYVGEVVGEVLPRAGGAWAQINDDSYALEHGPVVGHRERHGFNTGLSVWLEGGLAAEIEAVGRPAQRGDVVLLRGTVLRADPDDGGGITLRATELETLAGPLVLEPPLHRLQVVVAVVLSLLALAATLWARHVRNR
ncbi:MAG: hypothetical protein WD638_06000 [Nitriliruptoraceae bacterium]